MRAVQHFLNNVGGNRVIIGVDEAGRGALIGNVVAAAVVLPEKYNTTWVVDSKTLSEQKREQFATYIRENAIAYAIGQATPAEIDTLNIHHATLLAMQRAITHVHQALSGEYDEIWIDGKFVPDVAALEKPATAFIKGDALHDCISAASILAKTERDAQLRLLHEQYPQYGFAQHKGYPTKAHREALITFGILPEHRRSYKTVAENNKLL